jgi:hypothetical protein
MGTDIGSVRGELNKVLFYDPQKNTNCHLFPKKLLHNFDKTQDDSHFEDELCLYTGQFIIKFHSSSV